MGALVYSLVALLALARAGNAQDQSSLECDALASVPATANCELDVTTGYLKIGKDGKIDDAEGRPLYYKAFQGRGLDDAALTALVVAADGPGLPLAHVENYKYLACHKGKNGARYKVVVYDPVGVGQSSLGEGVAVDTTHNGELLAVSYRGREYQTVAENFAAGKPFVAVGHGTGAATVVQCTLDCGAEAVQKIKSIVLASPVLSCNDYIFKLKSNRVPTLPAFYADLLLNSKTTSPFYANAAVQFQSAFYCRISNPVPACIADALSHRSKDIFSGMWGASEYACTGTLSSWTDHKRLGEIKVPTWAFAMEHDTVDVSVLSKVFNTMPKPLARGELLPLGGHVPHVDAFATWYSAMVAWLDGVARAGEFVNVANPAAPPPPPAVSGAGAATATATVTATETMTVSATATAAVAGNATAECHPCHCPTVACDGTVKQSVAPLIVGFFVAAMIMTPVGYGLHALVRHMSRRGVFAQSPTDQYQTLTNVHHDEEI